MNFFSGKKILVAGGTGLIGRPLVAMLLAAGARVRVVSLDAPSLAPPGAEFVQADLTVMDNGVAACAGMDFVFQLLCARRSAALAAARPAALFVPNILLAVTMMAAARRAGVARYLHASSLAVYAPAPVFNEDDVWTTFPSPNDRFAGWAKRMGELQAEAYRIEDGWEGVSIVRPANTYGPWDDFTSEAAMVIPSLIRRAVDGEDPIVAWGDGSAARDFIHARDAARGMMLMMEKGIAGPVNLGSGTGTTIRQVVAAIAGNIDPEPRVAWDTSKPTGDAVRVLDTARAQGFGFTPRISLAEGIRETMDWYRRHRGLDRGRYDHFAGIPT